MPEPKIEILGVYKPFIPDDVYQEQWNVTGSDEDAKAHFENLVLIEALAHDASGSFKMREIGQQMAATEKFAGNFQCAYDEALLSADGETLIEKRRKCVHGTGTLRFAFYLHFYDASKALATPFGEVVGPSIQPVPARLMMLVPYNACS